MTDISGSTSQDKAKEIKTISKFRLILIAHSDAIDGELLISNSQRKTFIYDFYHNGSESKFILYCLVKDAFYPLLYRLVYIVQLLLTTVACNVLTTRFVQCNPTT